MGRPKKRHRRGVPPHLKRARAAKAGFSPNYVSTRPDGPASTITAASLIAPVLPLEGLDPWAQIAGPALLLDEPAAAADVAVTFNHPDQLELHPAARGRAVEHRDGAPSGAAPGASVEGEPAGPARRPADDAAEASYVEARGAADAGRTAEAMDRLRAILARYPQHLRSRNALALLLEAAGDPLGALTELDRALELDPEHTTLLTNRGALLGTLGRYAAAERDLRRVLRAEPSNVEALFNIGVVLTKKGLWGEAVPLLRRATELASDRGAAFYYLGEALNHVDDLLGALAAYLRSTELEPDNARSLYGLGIIYDRLARPDDAAQMYRKSREVARR
jgi:tetratricopeptide (TPR) repeat protein